jgi:NAD-dependent SIR2 family protein deacetylase
MQYDMRSVAKYIQQSDSLIITAGAGIGVDSGLPDFRGNEGFWQAYPALGNKLLEFSKIATPRMFTMDISNAWGFYGHRLNLYREIQPHFGFNILKRWCDSMPKGYWIFTSNVDGQFQKAGFSENQVVERHGSIHHLQCTEPCSESVWSAEPFIPNINTQQCLLSNDAPNCKNCGAPARPNILMFNDDEWLTTRYELQLERRNSWLSDIKKPTIIELGAGKKIPTVRIFSEEMAQKYNAPLIRINLIDADVSHLNGIGLKMGALDALQLIEQAMCSTI